MKLTQYVAGLDLPEMGSPGYAPDIPVPGGEVVPAPRPAGAMGSAGAD